jgi:hypothetical protein
MEGEKISGTMLILLLTSVLFVMLDVPVVVTSGTIYIRADGSIDPPTAPILRDKDTYMVADNVFATARGVSVSAVATVSNTILEAAIETQTGEGGVGTYTIRTGQDHPNSSQNVLFGGASLNPWSSYNTIKVYDTSREYVTSADSWITPDPGFSLINLDSRNPAIDVQTSTVVRIHWDTLENLRIFQEVGVQGTSMSDTKVYVSMWINNLDAATHYIGFRFLNDLMIDGWDGSWLRPEATGPWLDMETEWAPPPFDFWETTNYPLEPLFYIYGNYSPTPSNMIFAQWSYSFSQAFLYTPTGIPIGSNVSSVGGEMDSAVLHYWGVDPIELPPEGNTWVKEEFLTPLSGQPPYDVAIRAHCNTEGVGVGVSITMDDLPTGYTTPHTFTGLTGTHTFTVPNTDPSGHPFWQWSTSEITTTISVSLGGTYVSYYGAQTYDVTVKAHDNTEGIDVSVSIAMDGLPSGYNTPHTFTALTGTHTFTVPNTDSYSHPFKQWNTGEMNRTITVTSGGAYAAYYETPPPSIHDVALTNIRSSKTVVAQGYSTSINVTSENQGDFSETFNVTLCANLVEAGLVGYWNFDEGSGTIAYDSSGNGNSGAIYGATWIGGRYGNGLNFDGISDYVDVGNSTILNPASAMSISAWIFLESYAGVGEGQRTIVERRKYDVIHSYQFMIFPAGDCREGHVRFSLWSSGIENVVDSVDAVTLNQWYHIVATYDGTNAKIYINGVQNAIASLSGSIDSTNLKTLIGAGDQGTTNFFNGTIDEVRIYNRALLAGEVWAEYTHAHARFTIETKTVTLESGASTTFTFTWNTTGFAKGNYTISAYAWPILGETDLDDNNCTDGWILITKVGDFGGGLPPQFFKCDGVVDGKDKALFLLCYRGVAPSEAMYLGDLGGGLPPQFFKCDGKVDGKDKALFLLCYKGQGP